MKRYSRVLLSAVIGALLATTAMAEEPAIPMQDPDAALAAQLNAEEAALRPQRQAFQQYFRQAYARYPAIPAGPL
jgi:hypothetical protein